MLLRVVCLGTVEKRQPLEPLTISSNCAAASFAAHPACMMGLVCRPVALLLFILLLDCMPGAGHLLLPDGRAEVPVVRRIHVDAEHVARQTAKCTSANICGVQQRLESDVAALRNESEAARVLAHLLSPVIIAAISLRIFASVVETSARKAPGWTSFCALLAIDSSTRLAVIGLATWELIVLVRAKLKGSLEFNGLLAATVLDTAITVSSVLRMLACFACLVATRKCTLLNPSKSNDRDHWDLWDSPYSSDPMSVGKHEQAEQAVRQYEIMNDVARRVLQRTEYVWGSLGLVMLVGCLMDAAGWLFMRGRIRQWLGFEKVTSVLKFLSRFFAKRFQSHHLSRWLGGVAERTDRSVPAGCWVRCFFREVHHRCILALVLHGHFEDKHVVALDEQLATEGLRGKPLFVVNGTDPKNSRNVNSGDYFPPLAPTVGLSLSILLDRSLSAEAFCRQLLGVVDERLRLVSRILDDAFYLSPKQDGLEKMLQAPFKRIMLHAPVPSLILDPSRSASYVARVALCANTLRGLLLTAVLSRSVSSAEEQARVEAAAKDDNHSANVPAEQERASVERCRHWGHSTNGQSQQQKGHQQAHTELGEDEMKLAVDLFYGLKLLTTRHPGDAFILQKGYWWSRARLSSKKQGIAEQDDGAHGRARTSPKPMASVSWDDNVRDATGAAIPTASTADEYGTMIYHASRATTGGSTPTPPSNQRVDEQQQTRASAAADKNEQQPPAWQLLANTLQHFSALGLLPWMVASDLGIEELDGVYLAMGPHRSQSAEEQASRSRDIDTRLERVLRDIHRATGQLRLKLAEPTKGHGEHDWCFEGEKLYPTLPERLLETLNERTADKLTVVPAEISAVFTPSSEEPMRLDEMLQRWHRQWRRVLASACQRDGMPENVVLRLPLIGFYPSMRLALDAYAGVWEPIEAAVVSTTATIIERPGRPPASTNHLEMLRNAMEERKKDEWVMPRVHAASTFTTILLSTSATEAALYRRLLHVTDAEDRRGSGTSRASDTAVGVRNAFASVALTGKLVASLQDGVGARRAGAQQGSNGSDQRVHRGSDAAGSGENRSASAGPVYGKKVSRRGEDV